MFESSYRESEQNLEEEVVTPEDLKISEALLLLGFETGMLVPEVEHDAEGNIKSLKLKNEHGEVVYFKDVPFFAKLALEQAHDLDKQKN